MSFKETEIGLIGNICVSLSIIGNLFIIFSYLILTKLHKKPAYSFLCLLVSADLIRCAGIVWGSQLSDSINFKYQCSVAGFITNSGGLSCFLFITVITIAMYTSVHLKYVSYWDLKQDLVKKRQQYIAVFIWSIALIVSLLPLSQSSYGYIYIESLCWISNDYIHWRWICFDAPLMFTLLFVIIMYILIMYHLGQIKGALPTEILVHEIFIDLKYYPLILLIAFSVSIFKTIYNIFDDKTPFWLNVCVTVSTGLYGALNAFLYGINCYHVTAKYSKFSTYDCQMKIKSIPAVSKAFHELTQNGNKFNMRQENSNAYYDELRFDDENEYGSDTISDYDRIHDVSLINKCMRKISEEDMEYHQLLSSNKKDTASTE